MADYTFTAASNLANGALAQITERTVWDSLQRSHFMWNRFGQKRGVEINSRKREIVHHLTDGQVGTWRPEGGTIPRALPEREVRSKFGYTEYYHPFSYTPEAKAEMGQESSLMSLPERLEMKKEAMKSNLSAFFYGDASAAVAVIDPNVTVVRGAGAGTVAVGDVVTLGVTNDTVAGVGRDDYGGTASNGIADLKIDSEYDVWNVGAATDVLMCVVKITKLNSPTTFTGTISYVNPSAAVAGDTHLVHGSAVADGDISLVTPPGSRTSAGISYAMHGLAYHLVSATQTEWQTLNPSTDVGGEYLRSKVRDMDGAPMTPGTANYLEDSLRLRLPNSATGDRDMSMIVSGVGQHTRLRGYLNFMRRADYGERTYKPNSAMDIENQYGNKWVVDPQAPDTRVYNLMENAFSMAVLIPLGYYDFTGNGDHWMTRPTGVGAAAGDLWEAIHDGAWRIVFDFMGRRPELQAATIDLGISDLPVRRSTDTVTTS